MGRHSLKFSDAEKAKMASDYKGGVSMKAIERKYLCSRFKIRCVMRSMGIELNAHGGCRKSRPDKVHRNLGITRCDAAKNINMENNHCAEYHK